MEGEERIERTVRRQTKQFDSIDLQDKYGIDLNRLVVSLARSRKILQRYREERREAVRQDVGLHYSDDGTRQRVPINLIGLYERIVGTSLLSANPRFLLSTFQSGMKAALDVMQSWINKQIQRMQLVSTLKRVVTDALYSIGIAKVALASPADAAMLAWNARAGEPLVTPIDLDDWVYDTHANRFEEVLYMGHRFRVPLEAIQDSKLYDKKARQALYPSLESRYNLEGDERISQIGKGLWWHQDDPVDMVDLWEIYLPQHRMVITLANDLVVGPALVQTEGHAEPLRVQSWIGPDTGPYHILAYKTVGGNAMPKGPILDLIDLHETANQTFRKLERQAARQKDNLFVAGGADADGNRVMNANDGEVIRVDRPDQIKPTTLGGPNQQNTLFFQMCQQLFSWSAGNLDILGGLSPQAKTLGQDKMLNQNSSRVVSGMQDTTVNYVEGIGRALCWYWWHDPYKVMKAPYSPKGMDEVQVQRSLHPADQQLQQLGELTRHGQFEDMEIQVDPFSLQHTTPQERIAALDQMVQTVIVPMMPMLQQAGVTFDAQAYLKIKARYQNMPELEEVLTMGNPMPPNPDMGQEQAQPGQPAQTERKYVRENRSERTMQGTMQNLLTHSGGMNPGGSHTQTAGGLRTE